MNLAFTKYHQLSAKDFLARLEKDHGFEVVPPINVERIVELVGARLDSSVDFENISAAGSVSIHNHHARIWVNPLESSYEPRKRFTIAHEIGHLIQHIDPEIGVREFIDTKKTLNRKDSYWDSKEYEANNFAAQLLMPVSLLKKHGNEIIAQYKKKTGGSGMSVDLFIERMASLFNVSEPAMKYRLRNIGAIKPNR
ncbi:ImmA/IrrE family metallo-endopeptidase [Halochromatium salexigens]|uniref:IrrE N-terminal-like domain-containing protein n=1 Tax=Halochromatium salexigens TaxID=49447 RepID=A0AAJ0UDQ2_HALSE|nr:ImmA/IrrE family metallo-endopeptidase [Halochromatium salexigens]MBK5929075.1 hypothetical protein [Halochromatium salexigens]